MELVCGAWNLVQARQAWPSVNPLYINANLAVIALIKLYYHSFGRGGKQVLTDCAVGVLPLVGPKILEPRRRQFCISDSMLYVLVTQICLQGTRIDALVCQLKPASMAQHMWVNGEVELGHDTKPCHQLAKSRRREWRATRERRILGRPPACPACWCLAVLTYAASASLVP